MHETARIGKTSELTAALALINTGWQGVSFPIVDTDYDVVAKDPVNGEWATFQVKSLRKREDRNSFVIPGKKSNGQPYSPDQVTYMLAVDTDDNTCWLTECLGYSEYWTVNADKRWIKLTTDKEEKVS